MLPSENTEETIRSKLHKLNAHKNLIPKSWSVNPALETIIWAFPVAESTGTNSSVLAHELHLVLPALRVSSVCIMDRAVSLRTHL